MDQVQIHIVDLQAFQAFLNCHQCSLLALCIIPHLGGQEDMLARDTALSDRFANAAFIPIYGRRSNAAIADFQG
jgi:hypothetical protein